MKKIYLRQSSSYTCLTAIATAIVTATCSATMAYADTQTGPVSAELVLEWQNEYRASSDDASIDQTNNSFVRAELAPTIRLNDYFFIDGVLVFEPFDQAAEVNAGNDIWFDREGAFAEELKLNFQYGPYGLWAGKFNPAFGRAWDYGRGIWGEDFAEDYEITQKIGTGASYTLETEDMGTHTFAASTFFADTSALSDGVITGRNQAHLSDGGASNTGDFSSFVLAMDGENAFGAENLGYMLSYRSLGEQSKNRDATTDKETGYSATLTYLLPISEYLSFDLFGEYAALRNFEGVKDADRDYYTASAKAVINHNWNVTLGYTLRDIKDQGNDHLLQASGGYDFNNGLTAEIGWRSAEEESVDTNIIGGLLRYTYEF